MVKSKFLFNSKIEGVFFGGERVGKRVKTERKTVSKDYSLDYSFQKFVTAKTAGGRTDKTLNSYHENYGYFIEYLEYKGIERNSRNMTPELMRNYIVYMLKEKVRF